MLGGIAFGTATGSERIEMLRQRFTEGIPEDQPDDEYLEAIFESESGCSTADYVEFLEEVRSNHPNIYQAGLLWFMRSRVNHYMSSGQMEKVDEVVIEDAAMMTDTNEAYLWHNLNGSPGWSHGSRRSVGSGRISLHEITRIDAMGSR